MPRKPTGDAHLDAEIDRAMRPYRTLLPPEMQEVFEDLIVMAYTEHPTGQAILARLRPRADLGGSGRRAVFKDDETAAPPGSEPASKGNGRAGEERRAKSRKPGGKGGSQ